MLGFAPVGSTPIGGLPLASGGGAAYTLTAARGSLSLTAQAVGLKRGLKVASALGSVTLSGSSTGLRIARKVAAAQGSVSLAGQPATPRAGRFVAAAQGSAALSGIAPALAASRRLAAGQGSAALSGSGVGLVTKYTLAASTGSVGLSGQAATLSLGTANQYWPQPTFDGTSGLTLGSGWSVSGGEAIADIGSFFLDAAVSMPRGVYSITIDITQIHSSLALRFYDATGNLIVANNYFSGGSTTVSLPLFAPAVRAALFDGGLGARITSLSIAFTGYLLTPAPGAVALSGQPVDLLHPRTLIAGQGAVSLAGQSATLRVARLLGSGSIALTGSAVTLRAARKETAAQGSAGLTGQAVTLSLARYIRTAAGSAALTGQTAAWRRTYALSAGRAGISLAGIDIGLARAVQPLIAGSGSLTVTGGGVTAVLRRMLPVSPASIVLMGSEVEFSGWLGVPNVSGSWTPAAMGLDTWTPVAPAAGGWVQ